MFLAVARAGFMGSEAFVEQMLEQVAPDSLGPDIARKSRPAPSLESIARHAADRNDAIRQAYATTGYTLTEIARHFGLHLSTVSRIARKRHNARNKT